MLIDIYGRGGSGERFEEFFFALFHERVTFPAMWTRLVLDETRLRRYRRSSSRATRVRAMCQEYRFGNSSRSVFLVPTSVPKYIHTYSVVRFEIICFTPR